MRPSRIVAVVLLTLALGGCGKMFGIRRADAAEPPPQGLQNLPQAPGYHLTTLPTAQAVDDFCRAWGVSASDDYNAHQIAGCVVPALHAEVMPAPSVLNDPQLWQDDSRHETVHEYGAVHDASGKGWFLNAPPPSGIDPNITAALLALPKTQAYQQALAQATQPVQTASASPQVPPSLPASTSRQGF